MTTQIDNTSVRASVEVGATPERAFQLFTDGINSWWLPSHHIQDGELAQVSVEPFVGGTIVETMTSGQSCTWGRVLRWEPPHTFAFSWLLGPDWAVPAQDAPGSRVTVTFTATASGARVDLVHDRLDVHGPGWEAERESVGGEAGWPALLAAFAAAT